MCSTQLGMRTSVPKKTRLKKEHYSYLLWTPCFSISRALWVLKTYERARCNFFWKGVKRAIQHMVGECDTCQCNKGEMILLPRLLKPLPIPTRIWIDISMDFIEVLPKSRGKIVILVVVDHLSKYSHFCALSHPYTSSSVAQIFMDQIFHLHGIPSSIVSDRDATFTSHFWTELFQHTGN